MRNWIVRAVVALTSALVAAPAFALPGTTGDVEWPVELTFGSCSVVRVDAFDEMDGNAYVGVKKNDAYYFPALTYWEYFEGNWEKTELGVSNLTEAIIASCLGTDPTDVSSLNNVGATGEYAAQTHLGFSFTLASGTPYQAGTYAYYIGDWPTPVNFANVSPTEQSSDADANLTASATVTEPVSLDTTIDSDGKAIDLFDFAISDGGSADGLATTVSQIVVNVSGTASDAQRDQITWRLDGPGASNITGMYNPANDTITFSSLSISVADGGYETYTINGYFNDNTNLTEDLTIILSLDGDTDVTADASGTQFGSTFAVNNGSGTTINVTATTLAFTTQPAGSTSGSALTTQPVVTAQDAFGNTDADFNGTVTLTEAAAGTLSGSTSMAAVSGVASFTGLIYTATADQQDFTLTASSGMLSAATANSVTSDVVATTLIFTTQPAPTSFPGKQTVTFTTVPVVQAVDVNSVVDTDFTGQVTLGELGGDGSATFGNESVSAIAGVATFTGLDLTYTNSGTTTETFKLGAFTGSLTGGQSSELTARLAPSVTGVTSSTTDGSYKVGDAVSIQVTFSEAVDVSGSPQLTLETGTTDQAATYETGTGTSTLTFTYNVQEGDTAADLDYTGTDALSLNGGSIKSTADAADATLTLASLGQTGSLGASKALVIDTSTPSGYSVSLDQDPINDANDSAASFTFVGAEVGTDYSYTISSSGGGTDVTENGKIETATDQFTSLDVSGLADGTLILSVTLTDAAGNIGSAVTDTVVKDATAPTVALTSNANDPHSGLFTVTATFSEAVTGFELADITVGNGTASNLAGSGTTYTFDVTPDADGGVTVDIAADVAEDAASNGNATATQLSVTTDQTGPTVALTSNANVPHSGLFTVTATFSEAVTGFELADITVGNGTASNLAGSGTTYTFDVTPDADGVVTVDIAADVAEDAASNGTATATQLSVTTDQTGPTVVLTSNANVPHSGLFTVTATFSEAVTGFELADITVGNGTASNLAGSGTTYTFDVTPDADGVVTVDIAADVAEDAAMNGNATATQLSVTTDQTGPTVVLTSNASDPHSGLFTVNATFSEAVTGFELADITVGNGTASNLAGSGTTYTFDVTPDADGVVTVDIAADVAQDAATNGNAAATQLSITTDQTGPTVALTSNANDPHSGLFTVTATFSEAVTGLELAEITVGNGTASNLAGSGTTYTFDVTPVADGDVTVDIAADVAQDAATNGNAAATQLSVTTDQTAPTVQITGPTDVVTADFTVTVTFSETVMGFTAEDVTVTNGTKGAFSGSDMTYALVITPELGTTVAVSVASNVAEDDAGNGNEVSNTLEVSAGSPASEFAKNEAEIRQVIVDDAQRALNSTLASNQRMTRAARNRFMISRRQMADEGSDPVSRNNFAFDVDGMAEISGGTLSSKGSFFEQTGNYEGTYRRLFFGDFDVQHDTDTGSTTATLSGKIAWEHMVSEQTMLGYFIGGELGRSQIDGTFNGDQNSLGASIGGYFVSALQDNLFADGFVSMGIGRNDLTMGNGTLDLESDYATRTLTLGTGLTGVIEREGYEIWPELAFTYGKTFIGNVDFIARAYGLVDNTLSLDAGDISIANLTFRPEFRVPMDGLPSADSLSLFTFAPRVICEQVKTTVTTEDCGGGAELGIVITSEDGMTDVNARMTVDRIGDSTRSGLQLNIEHRF